jgi:hypothetical protein
MELDGLNQREADRILANLRKLPDQNEEEFKKYKVDVRPLAFKLTISILGGEDNVTKYGESADLFLNTDLPYPITTIFFTNENAYKGQAQGASPPNFYKLWLHFTKPPLFDHSPLLSAPTPNASTVKLKAEDLAYFRAAQSIVTRKLRRKFVVCPHSRDIYV